MKNRRKFVAALATAVPFLATAAPSKKKEAVFRSCPSDVKGPMSDRFGQVIVTDQHNKKSWFYEELVHDKLVLVSFSSVRGEKHYPIIDNLVKVQDMLKDRLGKDVTMLTITTNPTKDTPDALKKLADSKGAKWQFLTGDADDIRNLLLSFGIRGSISGLSWVGNEKTGRWMTKASRQHPLFIAEAVARLSTGKEHKPFLVDLRSV
jgi:cytochrome oxidase Cu insertion factor (SCO1/SenC/PrrC family)